MTWIEAQYAGMGATAKGPDMDVIFIAGAGRSGSTILAYLLGSIPGYLNVGEASSYVLNERFFAADFPCGCGSSPQACSFWARILRAVPREDRVRGAQLLRNRYVALLTRPWLQSRSHKRDLAKLRDTAVGVLSAAGREVGAEVIVDASKSPAVGLLLAHASDVRLHVVHLTRDPRGVVSSWKKPKEYLRRFPPLSALRNWLMANAGAERLADVAASYQRVRYEDFVERPAATVELLLGAMDRSIPNLDFIDGLTARVTQQHALAGNPGKLAEGAIRFSPPSWHLSRTLDLAIRLVARRPMRRYGYHVSSSQ